MEPGRPALRHADADFVTDRLLVGGDLEVTDPDLAYRQASELREVGVTHVLDVRAEASDAEQWSGFGGVSYHWNGIDDLGQRVPDPWFDDVVGWAQDALARPGTRVLSHCHAGINRGPSAGYAVLLAQGWDPVDALEAIRQARPAVFVGYAEDALRWHHARTGVPPRQQRKDRRRVAKWRREHALDTASIIRQIREAGG